MTRRDFLRYTLEASGVVALAGACLIASTNGSYVRPPGAVHEERFFRRCVKCGVCVEVCPSNALDFVGLVSDVKNIGTPELNISGGGCIAWKRPCMRCIEACPTGALLKPVAIKDVRMGSGFVEARSCINCMMCFRVCPRKGAVLFPNPKGEPFKRIADIPLDICGKDSVLKPYIDNSLCVGCGLCAHICPPKCIKITPDREVRMRA